MHTYEDDEESALLALEPDEFAAGIARMIEYVMENKEKKPTVLNAMLSSGTPTAEQNNVTSYHQE